MMGVPLNAREAEYVAEQIRSGRAANEEEVLREALQIMMERDAGGHEKYDAWRRKVWRSFETGYREMLAEDTVGGEEVAEQLRRESEARRGNAP
jgi:Arc/MetJ-type ribon-helix-helix transcriptional regulator